MLPLPDASVERVRHVFVQIRDRDTRSVVTVIEVLSPGNKQAGSDGRREYLNKRALALQSDVNLVEIDLLRDGVRLPMGEPLPPAEYYALISRAVERPLSEVVPIDLREPLPSIPVPLAGSDPEVLLDLQAVFTSVYERSGYAYALDYQREVTPPLKADASAWVASMLRLRGPGSRT